MMLSSHFDDWPANSRDYWPTHAWRTKSLQASGIDPHRLDVAIEYAAAHFADLHSILIVHQGYLVFEHYYPGSDRPHIHRLHSATYAITAALVGVALARRHLQRLDLPLSSFLPSLDATKRHITLRQLISMPSGLYSNDDQRQHPVDRRWPAHEDSVAALGLPYLVPPGQQFDYASSAVQLFAPILAQVTQLELQRFADARLFQPLGIRNWVWERDGHGTPLLSVGLSLSARDMAKVGFLYLNRGLWDTNRILPAAYVVASTRQQHRGAWPMEIAYGYGWWLTQAHSYPAFFVVGYGEQYIYVVPKLDTVIVLTGNDQRTAAGYQGQRAWIEGWLIPALAPAFEQPYRNS